MPNVSIAVYVPPGRCPGLWATFGLTARPNHLPGVCANWFVFNTPLPRLGKGLKYVSSRALRIIFPEKPFNPALIHIAACNQTGCECIVCTLNPSLMKGLSCPKIDLYICNVCAFQAKTFIYMHLFLAFFFEIFGYARQYEQALLHSLARKFGYARHSPNKFLKIRLLAMAKIE